MTIPVNVRVRGVSSALVITVTVFTKAPFFAALKVAMIVVDSPGLIGVLLYVEVVHPQLTCTLAIITGVSPVLSKMNLMSTGLSCGISPMLISVVFQEMDVFLRSVLDGEGAKAMSISAKAINDNLIVFIFLFFNWLMSLASSNDPKVDPSSGVRC
jgi:hypothetical protein